MFTHNETIRAGLENYLETHNLTHAEIARKLGFTPTRVTKYLGLNKPDRIPEPDAQKVETAAKAFLRHADRRATLRRSLFPNKVSQSVANILKLIRSTGDIGLLYGPAGVGKTCGAELFCNDNWGTVLITATRYQRNARSVERLLGEELTNQDGERPHGTARALWIEQLLRGTERLIIVDNAHKLNFSGLEFLFDLHDATLCPIALIGNPEVIHSLCQSDQLFSRVGVAEKITMPDDAPTVARELIKRIAPDSEPDLADEATNVVSQRGHVRLLKKQLSLAKVLHDTGSTAFNTWQKSFEAAASKLVRNQRHF